MHIRNFKFKNFYTAKETIHKVKRQSIGWKEIFANLIDKGLIPIMYKELKAQNSKKQNNTKQTKTPQKIQFKNGQMT